MKRLPLTLVLIIILVLPLSIPYQTGLTDDCFVQIVSVTINQSSLEIGEKLQVNIVYDLYYDQTDPLGIGSVSVSINIQGVPTPLSFYEFTNQGLDVQEIITFDISPNDWSPNDTGQVGIVNVEGWAQDSVGSMTDSVQQQFIIQRSNLLLQIDPPPSQISFHELFNLTGVLANPHNSTLLVPNYPLIISISQNNQTIQSWNPQTVSTSNFSQVVNSTSLGSGAFSCNFAALDSDDYSSTNSTISLYIDNASLSLFVSLNSSTIQAYYPSMNNCSILVSAYVYCSEANHSLNDVTVSGKLGNSSKTLSYIEAHHFSTWFRAPSTPGNYSIELTAVTPYHDLINTSTPLSVVQRQAQISFTTNCSEAAYGDFIGFFLSVFDQSSERPIPNKVCSVYFSNQSNWNLLTQVILDQNGYADFTWQAQNVGYNNYWFKVIFHGNPEFDLAEMDIIVINTHDVRFICNSTLNIIRPNDVLYILQLTTLDFQPLFNVSVQLVEIATNSSWSLSTTNTSGYAILTWSINETFPLGPLEFLLIAQDGSTTLGTIPITMIVFEQTVLELV